MINTSQFQNLAPRNVRGPRQDASHPENSKQGRVCSKWTQAKNLDGIFFRCRVIERHKVRQEQCPYQNVQALYRLHRTSSSMAVSSLQRKKPTQRAKIIAQHKLCFLYLNDEHSFRQCPNPRKCTKEGCASSHNTLLQAAERIFPSRTKPVEQSQSLNNSSESSTQNPHDCIFSLTSVTLASKSDVKGPLEIVKVNLSSSNGSQTAGALCCDLACSHSWMTRKHAQDLKLEGRPICSTVKGINSQEVVNTEMVELNLSSLDGSRETY